MQKLRPCTFAPIRVFAPTPSVLFQDSKVIVNVQDRSKVKAARKASAAAALHPDEYSVTDFGRKRRSSVPPLIARIIGALRLPFDFLGNLGRRWRLWWGGKDNHDVSPIVKTPPRAGEGDVP